MHRHYAVVLCSLLLLCAIGVGAAASQAEHHAESRRCFPAASWDADQGLRPCVSVVHVEEDGSFAYRVSDADGTTRYTAGIGAQDR